jgi:hypothetical protein
VVGFRPPGGELTAASPALLARHGFTWCSPHGTRRERADGLASVPFVWGLVDAYHRLDAFAARRAADGDPEAALDPAATATALLARLAAEPAPTLILHPFLMVDDAGWDAARRVLGALAGRRDEIATAGAVAAAL